MSLERRIRQPGPKKILTIDGGGIRGVIALEILFCFCASTLLVFNSRLLRRVDIAELLRKTVQGYNHSADLGK